MITHLLFLLVPIFFASAEDLNRRKTYTECEIKFVDGNKFSGMIGLPLSNLGSYAEELYLKEHDSDELHIVNSSTVRLLKIKGAGNSNIVLEYSAIKTLKGGRFKDHRHYKWLEIMAICENFKYYNMCEAYFINKETRELQYIDSKSNFEDFIKKSDEQAASMVGRISFDIPYDYQRINNKDRQKALLIYFADNPKISNLFAQGKGVTAKELITFINSRCKKD